MRSPADPELRGQGGLVLPAMLIIYMFAVIMVLLLAHRALQYSRLSVRAVQGERGAISAEGGVGLGLARLARRVSLLPANIQSGVGDTFWMTDLDIARYATTEPGSLWTQNLPGVALADEAEFSTVTVNGVHVASFTVHGATHVVQVHLFPAGVQTINGYNDAFLRYGYEILSVDKKTGRKTRVRSYISQNQFTIQVRLNRPLSRYNLFAESNTLPPANGGAPVYDSTSYTGPVYSRNRMYLQGDPRFADTTIGVQISTAADSDNCAEGCTHRDSDGTLTSPCIFRRPSGSTFNCSLVNVDELPGSLEETAQKEIAYCGAPGCGALPGLDGIYPRVLYDVPRAEGGVTVSTVSVYVKGNASVCMKNLPPGATTLYHIKSPPPPLASVCDPDPDVNNDADGQVDFTQHVKDLAAPTLLIFADANALATEPGELWVRGNVSSGTKLTLSARENLIVVGSTTYTDHNGTFNSDVYLKTAIGLVSWNRHVLVTRNPTSAVAFNLYLDAVIMAPLGGFGAEGFENFPAFYNTNPIYKGDIRHRGAFIRKYAIPTLSNDLTRGWGMTTQYDADLLSNKAPPYFPGNGRYQLQQPELLRVVDLYRAL